MEKHGGKKRRCRVTVTSWMPYRRMPSEHPSTRHRNQQPTRKKVKIMTVRQLTGTTAIVTGASRGFGRAISVSLVERGALVVGVARNQELLVELKEQLGDVFTPEVADVADPAAATQLIADYRPQTVVLNAGATPQVGTLREQTWEMFSTNWSVDVRHVFALTQEVLTAPLDPGSVVVSLSSGAAFLAGSPPLSGGCGRPRPLSSSSAPMPVSKHSASERTSASCPSCPS